jgi:hypothetical protein
MGMDGLDELGGAIGRDILLYLYINLRVALVFSYIRTFPRLPRPEIIDQNHI